MKVVHRDQGRGEEACAPTLIQSTEGRESQAPGRGKPALNKHRKDGQVTQSPVFADFGMPNGRATGRRPQGHSRWPRSEQARYLRPNNWEGGLE